MIAFDDLLRAFRGLDRRELVRWIENGWVLPERRGESWIFHEVDVARVELIFEIRHEFAIDEEAMPLVLGLLDQVYNLRRQLRRMCDALAAQPADVRAAIRRALPPCERTGNPARLTHGGDCEARPEAVRSVPCYPVTHRFRGGHWTGEGGWRGRMPCS